MKRKIVIGFVSCVTAAILVFGSPLSIAEEVRGIAWITFI